MALTIKTLPTGEFQENCYLVADEVRNTLIIDPGADAEMLINEITSHNLSPTTILLTHAHFDHISAVKALAERFKIPVYLHPDDIPLYESPMNAFPPSYPAQKRPLTNDFTAVSTINDYTLKVIHTPGHTPGGCCLLFPDEKIMFTGDTLFNMSIGRTDLPGGNHQQLLQSIQEKLMPLNDDIRIYPGHGPSSTMGQEKLMNPYLGFKY